MGDDRTNQAGTRLRQVAVVLVGLVSLLVAWAQPSAQDYGIYVASTEVSVHTARDAYGYDGQPSEALRERCDSGGLRPERCVPFVAPPPALLAARPLLFVPEPWRRWLWTLAFLGLGLAALEVAGRDAARDAETRALWLFGLVAVAPVFAVGTAFGQVSTVLLAALVVARPGRAHVGAGSTLLAGAVWLKGTPLLPLMALLVGGRRSGVVALGVTVAVGLLAAIVLGVSSWADWIGSMPPTSVLAAGWPNASLAAQTQRLWASTGPALVVQAGLSVGAVVLAWRVRNRSPERAWALVWWAALCASPMLWVHYLVVLPALLLPSLDRNRLGFLGVHALLLVTGSLAFSESTRFLVGPLGLGTFLGAGAALARVRDAGEAPATPARTGA